MEDLLWGVEVPSLDGQSRFLQRWVCEDRQDAQDAADEICVERGVQAAKVVAVRLIRKGEM